MRSERWDRKREERSERKREKERERERVCVCVCVKERERKRERKRVDGVVMLLYLREVFRCGFLDVRWEQPRDNVLHRRPEDAPARAWACVKYTHIEKNKH
jgi:hypothetical protein